MRESEGMLGVFFALESRSTLSYTDGGQDNLFQLIASPAPGRKMLLSEHLLPASLHIDSPQ